MVRRFDPVTNARDRMDHLRASTAHNIGKHSGAEADPDKTGPPDPDAYSIAEFCERHRISIALFYKLKTQGLAPPTFKVGARTLISVEAAAAWRREREAATAAAATTTAA